MPLERIDPTTDERIMRLSRLGHIKRYHKALTHVNENSNVLDAGCGYGYGSHILASKAKKVIGIDISEEAIKYANKHYKKRNLEYMAGEISKKNLNKYSVFDVITFFEVVEHIKKPESALKALRNSIKENGILLMSVPNGKNTPSNNPHHLNEFSKKDIEKLLSKTGFRIDMAMGQYPLLGTLARLLQKATGYETDTDKSSSRIAKIIDSLPLLAPMFSGIYPSKVATQTCRSFYFVATPV